MHSRQERSLFAERIRTGEKRAESAHSSLSHVMTAVTLDSFMSGQDDDINLSAPVSPPAAAMAGILVVASQEAAADGSYQRLVTDLKDKGRVEMHMFDRITEGGKFHATCRCHSLARSLGQQPLDCAKSCE